ncbi:MAG: hypothetical protein H0V89_08030 [Deltaproteobacteria bacterium]|nr:hypothetical protein [Deltaproteobacteria bacterium]
MSPDFGTYVRRAVGFRPFGMLFPPHFALLVAFGLLGILNPGFLLIGLALELLYLLSMVSHPRFRAMVDREYTAAASNDDAVEQAVARLDPPDQARFRALRARCEELVGEAEHEAEALSGLLQVHLGLLGARATLGRLVAAADSTIDRRLAEVEARLAESHLESDLRRSLESQRVVLEQRAATQVEAERKLEYVEAELVRVEDQVALLREQAALAAGPTGETTDRVDAIAGAIAETRRWLDTQPNLDGTETVPLPSVRARLPAGRARDAQSG